MKKTLKLVFLFKFLIISLFLIGLNLSKFFPNIANAVDVKKTVKPTITNNKIDANILPVIPSANIGIAEASELKAQLELIRKDIELKLAYLKQSEASFAKLKTDVEAKLKKVEEEKQFMQDTLQKEKQIKDDRLKESIDFFIKMEARKAAPIMETMDKDLVILLLKKLPPKVVTKILENMTPLKATQFIEYYSKIKSGREYELLKELGLCNESK